MTKFRKISVIFKWSLLSVLTITLLMMTFYFYLYFTFDDKNLPQNHGQVHTKLYLGDVNNQPLIVGLGGSEGGNAWASDHWQAQRQEFIQQGYAFLAIGYFGMPGLPQELDTISLNGVHQAIMEAARNPKINGNCIAIIGGSKGAELALALASFFPDIKAVVAIVPAHAIFASLTLAMTTSSFTLNDHALPFVPVPWSTTPSLITGDLRNAFQIMLKDQKSVDQAAIKIENINGPVLLVSATQDEMWPSKEMSDKMIKRFKKHDFPHHYQHIAIEGDHSAPLNHFDQVTDFLNNHFRRNSVNCSETS